MSAPAAVLWTRTNIRANLSTRASARFRGEDCRAMAYFCIHILAILTGTLSPSFLL